jgi:hypothetical protein
MITAIIDEDRTFSALKTRTNKAITSPFILFIYNKASDSSNAQTYLFQFYFTKNLLPANIYPSKQTKFFDALLALAVHLQPQL